jgi:hypothetical protein
MTPKEEVLTKLSDTENFEGSQGGREHLELLTSSKAFARFEKGENRKRTKFDSMLMKLYLSL